MQKRNCIIFISLFVVISSTALFSNTYNTLIRKYAHTTPPPVNDVCAGATDLGVIECGYNAIVYWEDPEATPDPEATGNCISNTEPAQWYTFTTPDPLGYGTLRFAGFATDAMEVFTSTSGCSGLEYVGCGTGTFGLPAEPGTTYYVLTTAGFAVNGWWWQESYCDDPSQEYSFIADNPIMQHGLTTCGIPSDVVPCENDFTRWYEYTTGCAESELLIELSDYTGNEVWQTADEVSITAVLDDCSTIMAQYDANGLGYICSAMGNGESLLLEDLPPEFTFLIAYGSDSGNAGWFDVKITETSDADEVTNDECPEAHELINGVNFDLSNACSTLTPVTGQDAYIEICDNPSETNATVWYEYDPGDETQDITINLISTGIVSPAIAVYDQCIDNYLASICGTTLEFECIDSPILIQIASTSSNAGSYDIEIISSPSVTSDIFHDTCDGATSLPEGLNQGFSNKCATLTGAPSDALIQDCASQSAATVWFQFDPGSDAPDVTINLNSTGINSPAIAAYDDCVGNLLGVTCGTTLELICVESIIFIEVGSNLVNTGSFDLDISTSPSSASLVPDVNGIDICSGAESDISIDIPNGELVDIIVEIGTGTSASIEGMATHTFNGVNSASINDILTNSATTNQEAVYTISILPLGPSCPPEPIEYSILVFPAFNISPLSIEACLSDPLEVDINEIITGGSPPFSNISWSWNGVDPIGTGNTLLYDLTESGTLTVEVVDNEGCLAASSIEVAALTAIIPTFDFPYEYCQSDQDFISFPTISLEGIEGTWNPTSIDVSEITTTVNLNATFIPNDGFCSEQVIEPILVFTGLESDFDLPSTFCAEEDIFIFPDTDLNGFMGSWNVPSIDLSATSGPQQNTFVVSTPGCFLDYEYEYEVVSAITLEFDFPESICKNDPPLVLNNFSLQGYEGTWDIPIIDPSGTMDDYVTSTWSPLSGQSPCLRDSTITIAITNPVTPAFSLPDELCSLDTIFSFPTEDLQSMTGNWSIANIDPSNDEGIIISEFTPDDDCANTLTWEIQIQEPIDPLFDFDTLYCSLDSSFILPTESDNGVHGTWSIPIINPADLAGQEVTVQFSSSELDLCVSAVETVIHIEEAQDILFDIADEYCWTHENVILPNTSLNGVSGSWEPSIIDIQANLGQSINIQFTPDVGNCFRPYTQEVEVLAPYIVIANTIDPSGCIVKDGSITLEVEPGQNFEFSNDFGLSWQSSNIFDALGSGNYTILVRTTDNPHCELTIDAFLNASDGPIINAVESTINNDCLAQNGSITIDAEGDNLEYSIDGINWQTTNIFEGLSQGNYEIEIRETLSDCIISATAVIVDFPTTQITAINTNNISDCNASDGSIEIIAEGQSLEYSIDNGITWSPSNLFSGLEAGTYEIITQSTEGINCTSTSEAVLIAPNQPTILNIEIERPSTCNPTNGSLLVSADGTNIEYSIDGGISWQDDRLFSELSSDEYQLIVREKENINCFSETLVPISIEIDQLEESILQATPISDCNLEDGSIEIINNLTNLEYSIDTGTTWQQTAFFDNLPFGFHLIISRKLESPDCRVEQSIEIPEADCPCNDLILEFDVIDISCEDEASGEVILASVEGMTDDNINILWQNGTTGPHLQEVEQGWQTVTVEYDEFCIWADSAYVNRLKPIQFELITSDISCQNHSDGTIEVVNVDGGSNSYMYSIDGENYQSENLFLDLEPGDYKVYVIDETDCLTSENVKLHSAPEIKITLPEIETIIQGESIVLDPEIHTVEVDSFSWTMADGIFNNTNLIIEVSPESTSTYVLEVYYKECYDIKEITIDVKLENNDIIVGNVFSPNGDNLNDLLYIQGSLNSNVTLNQFRIYDRWGSLLFEVSQPEINNPVHGWDGYSHGRRVTPGVYVYQISYIQNGQPQIKFGTVTVIN